MAESGPSLLASNPHGVSISGVTIANPNNPSQPLRRTQHLEFKPVGEYYGDTRITIDSSDSQHDFWGKQVVKDILAKKLPDVRDVTVSTRQDGRISEIIVKGANLEKVCTALFSGRGILEGGDAASFQSRVVSAASMVQNEVAGYRPGNATGWLPFENPGQWRGAASEYIANKNAPRVGMKVRPVANRSEAGFVLNPAVLAVDAIAEHGEDVAKAANKVIAGTTANLSKANAVIGAVDTVNHLGEGDYSRATISGVQTSLGVAANFLPKRAGVVGIAASALGGINDGLATYQATGNAGEALQSAGIGVAKAVAWAGGLAAAPTVVGATVSISGVLAGLEGAAAGAMGVAVAGVTGTAIAVGSAAIGTAAVGYGVGTLVDKQLGVSDAVVAGAYSGVDEHIKNAGQTSGITRRDTSGLPIIDECQNKELANILDLNSKEAQQLSANPQLAALGIINAQDPAYMKQKLEDTKKQWNASAGIFSGVYNWLEKKTGITSAGSLESESIMGAAEVQLGGYTKQFNKWQSQQNGLMASSANDKAAMDNAIASAAVDPVVGQSVGVATLTSTSPQVSSQPIAAVGPDKQQTGRSV